jgi:molybdopterin-synthase adenylyltransferase
MDAAAVVRYARQIALPEIGLDGQERICAARVLVVGRGVAADTAAMYLKAAGVRDVGRRDQPPTDAGGCLGALTGVRLVVRFGFDDDAMLGAAARLGVAAVVVRADAESVEAVSFSIDVAKPDAAVDVPPRAASATMDEGAAGVLAGALAAAEALTALARPADARPPAARHLRLPLDGRAPLAQTIGAP